MNLEGDRSPVKVKVAIAHKPMKKRLLTEFELSLIACPYVDMEFMAKFQKADLPETFRVRCAHVQESIDGLMWLRDDLAVEFDAIAVRAPLPDQRFYGLMAPDDVKHSLCVDMAIPENHGRWGGVLVFHEGRIIAWNKSNHPYCCDAQKAGKGLTYTVVLPKYLIDCSVGSDHFARNYLFR